MINLPKPKTILKQNMCASGVHSSSGAHAADAFGRRRKPAAAAPEAALHSREARAHFLDGKRCFTVAVCSHCGQHRRLEGESALDARGLGVSADFVYVAVEPYFGL